MLRDVAGADGRTAMERDARLASVSRTRHGHMDPTLALRGDAPERGRTAVAEKGIGATAEDRRHPLALPREVRPPDRVDA
jgi:hypothetical protein